MTYESFKERVANAGIAIPPNDKFEESWTVGGNRGSDCWGNDYGKFDAEPEPDYWILDDVLAAVCPGITLLAYRRLRNECVSYSGEQRDDYYGRHEELRIKRFYLREVFEFLVANGLLSTIEEREAE